MIKFIKILGILSITCLAVISLYTNTTHAQLTDGGSGYEDFELKFSDLQNGVNAFSFVTYEAIDSVDFYNGIGVDLGFYFHQYDVENDIHYKIDIDNNRLFGKYFIQDKNGNRKVRFLPGSELHLVEADRGLFGGGDDPIDLKVQYDGSLNMISMMENSKLQGSGTPDWNWQAILENIDITLNIEVPVKLGIDQTSMTNEHGQTVIKGSEEKDSEGNTTYIEWSENMKVTTQIKITKDGIIFDNGIDDLRIGKPTDPNEEKDENDDKDKDKVISEIKFQGKGLVTPEANKFKGISNEKNLEKFIVGVTNFVLGFVAAVAVIMLIYGGYLWIIDRGEGQLAEKSRKIIAGAVLGILIIISAYTIVNTVISLEGNPDECAVGFEIGNGTDFNLNCTTDDPTAVGVGVGGILGSTIGGWIGGDTGSVIGGLLGGGAGGAIGGGGN